MPVRTDAADIEKQAIERADKTLKTIEGFLSKWESARTKPATMIPQINKIKRFYRELSGWRNTAVSSKGNEEARLKRLREFVAICRNYS